MVYKSTLSTKHITARKCVVMHLFARFQISDEFWQPIIYYVMYGWWIIPSFWPYMSIVSILKRNTTLRNEILVRYRSASSTLSGCECSNSFPVPFINTWIRDIVTGKAFLDNTAQWPKPILTTTFSKFKYWITVPLTVIECSSSGDLELVWLLFDAGALLETTADFKNSLWAHLYNIVHNIVHGNRSR